MLDLNAILREPQILKNMLEKRGNPKSSQLIAEIESVLNEKKNLQTEVETLRAERNKVSKEVGILKSKGEDAVSIMQSMKELGDKLGALEEKLKTEDDKLLEINLRLPNLLQDDVPLGKSEEDNVELYTVNEKPKFDFAPVPHFDLGTKLQILDFERGVKLAGARSYTYSGLAAKLERALMNFMLDTHTKEHGYEEVWVPIMVNDESMQTTGQYPKFKDEYYRLEADGLNLVPTAEVPLTNLYRDEILPDEKLPLSITAHTSCFRREAGSYGKDTRGLVRVHQFQKIELVKFCRPEESDAEHKKLLSHAENILKKLKLHYRVLLLCSKDTSDASSKTFDIEVWMPGLNRYLEISSVSNFMDFQSRRGKIRYKNKEGKNQLVHTINGSGLAIGRTLAAIMENYQTKDGQIEIPEVLKKYL